MDEATTSLATVIGARVRQERQARNWTLDRLAECANVSRRMVINVEQGAVNPSVGTLLRLSDALGIGLPALVEPPARSALMVTRRGDGAALWSSEAGGRGLLVAGTGPPDVLELWDWTLAAGDRHLSEAHVSGTKELIQVQEGQVNVVAGGQTVVLEVGDAIGFPGDVPHSYANAGSSLARFSLAVYEPGVGAAATRPEVSQQFVDSAVVAPGNSALKPDCRAPSPRVDGITEAPSDAEGEALLKSADRGLHQVPLGGEGLSRHSGAPQLIRANAAEALGEVAVNTQIPGRWWGATTPASRPLRSSSSAPSTASPTKH